MPFNKAAKTHTSKIRYTYYILTGLRKLTKISKLTKKALYLFS